MTCSFDATGSVNVINTNTYVLELSWNYELFPRFFVIVKV